MFMNDYEEIKENLKGVQIVFENCESMFIPTNCIKQLKYEMEEYKGNSDIKNLITKLDCVIENDGSITRNPDFRDNESPVQRINQYDDICYFDFMYKDDSQDSNYVKWYHDEGYFDSQSNNNQTSKLLRYNTVHITVEPYIPKYSISEIFKFDPGTNIKDEDGIIYTIDIDDDIKHLDIPMDERHINMSYIRA